MLLLVDLDGVVYRGALAVPGMADVLNRRAAAGDRIIYVTNNSRSHRDEYRRRLEGHGVPLGGEGTDSIVTAARATAVLLAESEPSPRVAMVIGGPGLSRELREVGLKVVPPTTRGLDAAPDALVVGVDFSLSYERLSIAAEAVRRGARFVATNRDPVFPAEDHLRAGAGAIVAAVAVAAGREPDVVVGKPEPLLFETAAELAGTHARDAIVIGDGLLTDIRAANAVGARSVLMLTGVTRMSDLESASHDVTPTAIAKDAADLDRVLSELTSG
ncbi:MAG TPA: HAD-IIA family hydrolase [Candidatus Limnocylindrales bacterium]|nr:HAD-IIA family hydrolase [Candidatus Limnocylindrales bacterium]